MSSSLPPGVASRYGGDDPTSWAACSGEPFAPAASDESRFGICGQLQTVLRLRVAFGQVAQPGVRAGYGAEAAFHGGTVELFMHRLEVGALNHLGFVHQYAGLVGVGGLLHDRFECFE